MTPGITADPVCDSPLAILLLQAPASSLGRWGNGPKDTRLSWDYMGQRAINNSRQMRQDSHSHWTDKVTDTRTRKQLALPEQGIQRGLGHRPGSRSPEGRVWVFPRSGPTCRLTWIQVLTQLSWLWDLPTTSLLPSVSGHEP